MKYEKPPASIPEQITILKSRGLRINDEVQAARYLANIGYYRLTGYMYHLQSADGSHQFKAGTTFYDIIETYNFDKKLRYLFAAYIERIEIAMRTLIIQKYAFGYGFFWYTDHTHYAKIPVPDHIQKQVKTGEIILPRKYANTHLYINKCIKDSFISATDPFITRYKTIYTSEMLPPCNMAMEIISMGKLARMFEALKNSSEKQ